MHAELSRLIFALLTDYFSEAAGMVSSLQTFGEYAAWNPHWHTIVLEGGFDRYDKFVFIPIGASEELSQLWRVRVVEFFVSQKLINTEFAKNLLGWKHSGFSIESGTRIYDDRARESLSQYIVRAPVSLEKLYWDGVSRSEASSEPIRCCGTRLARDPSRADRYFPGLDFIAQLTLHIPPKGKHLVRRYGVYSSRSRGTWKKRPALRRRAAENWYGWGDSAALVHSDAGAAVEVDSKTSRKAWARLLAKVYEIDVLCCPKCGGRLAVIAVIRDPESIRKIIACMDSKGRGPP